MGDIKIEVVLNVYEDNGDVQMLELTFDKSQIKRVSTSSRIGYAASQPTWDVVSGKALLVIYDINDKLAQLAQQGTLNDVRQVKVFYGGRLMGIYDDVEAKYQISRKEMKLSCKDSLFAWNNIVFGGVMHSNGNTALTFLNILREFVYTQTGESVIVGEKGTEDDIDEINFLSGILMPDGSLEQQNLRQAWRKLCMITLGVVYKDNDGIVRFVRKFDRNPRTVTKSEILKPVQADLVIRNKKTGTWGDAVNVLRNPRENPNVPNVILQSEARRNYTIEYLRTRFQEDVPNQALDWHANVITRIPEIVLDISHDLVDSTIIEDTIPDVNVTLVSDRYSLPLGVYDGQNPSINFSIYMNLLQAITPQTLNIHMGGTIRLRSPYVIPLIPFNLIMPAHVNQDRRRFSGTNGTTIFRHNSNSITINATLNSFLHEGNMRYVWRSFNAPAESALNMLVPQYIEVTIRADTTTTIIVPFRHLQNDDATHAFEVPRNTLIGVNSSVNGTQLSLHINNNIVSKWADGKQAISGLEVVILDQYNFFRVGDTVELPQYFAGKQFRIISAEFINQGNSIQSLDLQEV